MACREGRADPEMRSAKRTTLCRALQSWFVALLYHTEINTQSSGHSEPLTLSLINTQSCCLLNEQERENHNSYAF